MTPTPIPALVESPLGQTLSFTAQVDNWSGKTAEARLDEKRIGTLDASGKLSVSTDSVPRYLYGAQTALLPLPPTADQAPKCSLDQVTVSDPQAQVGRVDQRLLREEKIGGQLQPLLSPPLPVPAVERVNDGQNTQTETVTALIYADRDVLVRGQRTCRRTCGPGSHTAHLTSRRPPLTCSCGRGGMTCNS
ncbi:hypothetical protein D3875_15180 [Deinococcus cavernae]|uniref:Uncharacterized protein n=1 Tax=Deinococcus cavernae TaxID=2320857 RepID=A0A418V987_9DEIO|nr:hypothetical protein [Deinococcus cavernae]RJF72685.1 hypothetical protein D3875_15180 [Deinococcus cavernae]